MRSGYRRVGRGLVSPHGTAGTLGDLGNRSPLVARQRIGRARARRRLLARLTRGMKWLGGLLAIVGALVGGTVWLLTTPRLAVRSIQVEACPRACRGDSGGGDPHQHPALLIRPCVRAGALSQSGVSSHPGASGR
jgi:hypothetical protein